MNVENYQSLVTKMINQMKKNQTKINDFIAGSIILSIFQSVARIIEQFYIDVRNGFRNNIKSIPYSVFDFKAKEGAKATGTVVFTRDYPIEYDSIIPQGTKVVAGTLIYETTEGGIIAKNQTDSNPVKIQAEQIGSKYNIDVNKIELISSIVASDVTKVTNKVKIEGGKDKEEEIDTYKRFINYLNGLQGLNSFDLKNNILTLPDIKDCSIEEHFPPVEAYNFTLWVDDGEGGLSKDVENEIIKIINGDGTEAYPGHKALGINFRVKPAEVKKVDVTYKIYLTSVEADVQTEIEQIIKSQFDGLRIGDTLYISNLISKIKSNPWVKDVQLITPTENIIGEKTKVIKLGELVRQKENE